MQPIVKGEMKYVLICQCYKHRWVEGHAKDIPNVQGAYGSMHGIDS